MSKARHYGAYKAQITKAINYSADGATIELAVGTAQALVRLIERLASLDTDDREQRLQAAAQAYADSIDQGAMHGHLTGAFMAGADWQMEVPSKN